MWKTLQLPRWHQWFQLKLQHSCQGRDSLQRFLGWHPLWLVAWWVVFFDHLFQHKHPPCSKLMWWPLLRFYSQHHLKSFPLTCQGPLPANWNSPRPSRRKCVLQLKPLESRHALRLNLVTPPSLRTAHSMPWLENMLSWLRLLQASEMDDIKLLIVLMIIL